MFHVHCRHCGNFDVQRISGRYVERWHSGFFRLLRVPAYRCAPCRHRFFSVFSYGRIRSIESQMELTSETPVESRVASN